MGRIPRGSRKQIGLGILKFVVLGVLCIGGLGFVIMTLWNWLVPELFHGPHITFWQALGILLLSKLLFGWHNSGGHDSGWGFKGKKQWKDKMMTRMERLDPEQRERIRDRFAERYGECVSRSRFGRSDKDSGPRGGGYRDWRDEAGEHNSEQGRTENI